MTSPKLHIAQKKLQRSQRRIFIGNFTNAVLTFQFGRQLSAALQFEAALLGASMRFDTQPELFRQQGFSVVFDLSLLFLCRCG